MIGPIATRSRRARAQVAAREAVVARRRRQPEQPVPVVGGVQAQRAAGVGAREPPARGDQLRAVPQLPAPAPEREPARRERIQAVGELEAVDGRHVSIRT